MVNVSATQVWVGDGCIGRQEEIDKISSSDDDTVPLEMVVGRLQTQDGLAVRDEQIPSSLGSRDTVGLRRSLRIQQKRARGISVGIFDAMPNWTRVADLRNAAASASAKTSVPLQVSVSAKGRCAVAKSRAKKSTSQRVVAGQARRQTNKSGGANAGGTDLKRARPEEIAPPIDMVETLPPQMPVECSVGFRRRIRVGTDCSGMEAPILALMNLGVDFEHVFSCDIDKHARSTILRNFAPSVWFPDLTTRDNAAAPEVDLYVAGFPCQPFSSLGRMKGFYDERGRGSIFFDICDYIEHKRPRVFMLENVRGIQRVDEGQTWKTVLKTLQSIAGGSYMISWDRMDTRDHGVPQCRQRIYIVGVLRTDGTQAFDFTNIKKLPCPSIEGFLEPRIGRPAETALPSPGVALRNVSRLIKDLRDKGHDPLEDTFLIDCDSSANRCSVKEDMSPCMTRSRFQGYWITNRGRRVTNAEKMRLQGICPDQLLQVVPDNAFGQLIGNSMSVNVLERIFVRLLRTAKLLEPGVSLVDRWESAAKTDGTASLVWSSTGQPTLHTSEHKAEKIFGPSRGKRART